MQTQPFKRAHALVAVLNALAALPHSSMLSKVELKTRTDMEFTARALNRSRGKGGKSPTRTGHAHMKAVRTARKLRNKRRA